MNDHNVPELIDRRLLAHISGGNGPQEVHPPYDRDEAGFPVCDSVCRAILSAAENGAGRTTR